MALSTKNVNTESPSASGGLKPILSPGNHFLTIRGIELRKDKNWEKYGDKLVLRLETEKIDGLKGLPFDKSKPELGNYSGQVGFVSYSRWGFSDYTSPEGTIYSRIDSLLSALKTICQELGILKWFEDADGRFETIEEFVTGFNNEAPFKDIFFYATIYGREYMNGTYINHDLYMPRPDRTLGKPFSLSKEKTITFFESAGIERLSDKKSETTTQTSSAKSEVKETVHTEPAKPKHQSAAELAFMNEKKESTREERDAEFLNEINGTSDNTPTDIVKDDGEKLPWE